MGGFDEIVNQAENIASLARESINGASSAEMQRTVDWFIARMGRFTGSNIKLLMSTGRSSKEYTWNDIEKVLDFGAAAEKYIYRVAMERRTKIRDMEIYAKSLQYGKDNEPLLIQQLIEDGMIDAHEEVPFIEFKNMPFIGASPDGKVTISDTVLGYEGKCTTSWDGYYARRGKPIDEKHNDFWQFQAEMVALRTRKLLYATSYPGTTERYDTSIIDLSRIHAVAMIRRAEIANNAVNYFNENECYIHEAIEWACGNFNF